MGWFIFWGLVVFIIWMDVRSPGWSTVRTEGHIDPKREAAKLAAIGVGGWYAGKALSKAISGVNVDTKMYKNKDKS